MSEDQTKIIHTAFKSKLKPNNVQRTLMLRAAGCSRYAYNWALAKHNEQYANKEKFMGKIAMNNLFTATEKEEHEWLYGSTKCAPQQAIRNCDDAFRRFFKGLGKYPVFKKKGYDDSFYTDAGIYIKGNRIFIPKIGLVKIYEKFDERDKRGKDDLRQVKIKSIIVSKDSCGDWFVSFNYEKEIKVTEKAFKSCGADVGIKTFSTLSTGKEFETPKKFKHLQKKLKRTQRQLSRCPLVEKKIINKKGNEQTVKVGSKNREKKKCELAKIHRDIRNERMDVTHKYSACVTKNHSDAVIEDLNVEGMLKNHKLAASLSNSNFGEQKRQLLYKGERYNCIIYEANRFFPSSKTCSCCGHKKDALKLSERIFICEECGFKIGRDLNAGTNLDQLLYLETQFMKWIVCINGDKEHKQERYDDLKKRINETNREIHGVSLRTPQGSEQNFCSVKVSETGIRQQKCTQSADLCKF